MKLYNLFEYLSKAIESSYPVAILSSFAWGVLSILLSPCHLASIPLIVGFIIKRGKITSSRAFFLSLIFATGILITIALIGIITATAGRMMGNIGSTGNYIVGFIFIVVGLYLVDIIKLPDIGNKKLPTAIKNDFFFSTTSWTYIWCCTWALYLCLYGTNACCCIQNGFYKSFVFHNTSVCLWNWSLQRNCFCWYFY